MRKLPRTEERRAIKQRSPAGARWAVKGIHQIEKIRHCESLIVGCLAIGVKRTGPTATQDVAAPLTSIVCDTCSDNEARIPTSSSVEKWACDDHCGCVLAAAVYAAEGGGEVVPRRGRFPTVGTLSLARGEGAERTRDCDCARTGRVEPIQLRFGDCGEGLPARLSRGAPQSEKLRRNGEADPHTVQLRDERRLPGYIGGIGGDRQVHTDLLCGIFDGRQFGDQDGGRVRHKGAAGAPRRVCNLP